MHWKQPSPAALWKEWWRLRRLCLFLLDRLSLQLLGQPHQPSDDTPARLANLQHLAQLLQLRRVRTASLCQPVRQRLPQARTLQALLLAQLLE